MNGQASSQAGARGSRPLMLAAMVFLAAAVVAATLVWHLEQQRQQEARARAAILAQDHAHAIQGNIERTLSATYALAAMVRQGQGNFDSFEEVAGQMLPLYPGAYSLQLAPGGVTRRIVPRAGNEKAFGHDLLKDPVRDKEARFARDSRKLTLAGPFELVQGGLGAVGRFPVFLGEEGGSQSFWGFATVVMRFPDLLETVHLPRLGERGFGYELWRIHPDTGKKQIIAASSPAFPLDAALEYPVQVPNATWTLSIAPFKGWGDPLGVFLKGALGLFFSLLLAWLTSLLVESRAHEAGLEALVATRTAEIRESEQRFRVIANASPALFWTAGLDKGCDWFNQPWLDFTGRSMEQELGNGWAEGVHPDDLARCLAIYGGAFDARRPFSMEYRLRRHDGAYRWLIDQGMPRYAASGEFVGYIGSCLDISEEKHLRDQVEQSEAHYRHLFEHNPAPMLIYERNSLLLIDVNAAFQRHYGYSREEALALRLPDLYPPAEQERITALVERLHGPAFVGEWHHRKKDGAYIDIVAHSHDLQYGGRDCRVAVITDITALKQAEQALRQRNAELEQFNAASVGRELRMIELKREVNALSRQLGQPPLYDLDFAVDAGVGAEEARP